MTYILKKRICLPYIKIQRSNILVAKLGYVHNLVLFRTHEKHRALLLKPTNSDRWAGVSMFFPFSFLLFAVFYWIPFYPS